MARKRISEYKAKSLILPALGVDYQGLCYKTQDGLADFKKQLDPQKRYVAKVDQGVKKRFKNGLVILDASADKVLEAIKSWQTKGYNQFIVEPFSEHDQTAERYLALERVREGIAVTYSNKGGINIEDHTESLKKIVILNELLNDMRFATSDLLIKVGKALGTSTEFLTQIVKTMNVLHFSFLEINPLIITDNGFEILDMAVEVDSAAVFFVTNAWTEADYVSYTSRPLLPQEKAISALASKSQASFSFEVINPNGSIFLLLSGGGGSVTIADEVYNLGQAQALANYGEYSGNPSTEETYLYTKELLSLLIQSTSKKKVLIIAGGVANFTDIRATFKGVIQAIAEVADDLRKQNVLVFVRRGGPHQREGLQLMTDFLKKEKLFGEVAGPEMVLTDIVKIALKR